jgi:hypothetical protein
MRSSGPICFYVKWPSIILIAILCTSLAAGCKGPNTSGIASSKPATEFSAPTTTFERTIEVATVLATAPIMATMTLTATHTIAGEVLIEFHRSGGFLGLDDHLTIGADRKVALTRRSEYHKFEIDQRTLEELLQELDEADFLKLEKEYLPVDDCCDLIEYTITYMGHAVRTMDTAVPASLQPVLDSLSKIVETQTQP